MNLGELLEKLNAIHATHGNYVSVEIERDPPLYEDPAESGDLCDIKFRAINGTVTLVAAI